VSVKITYSSSNFSATKFFLLTLRLESDIFRTAQQC
jgi:hypothetical protein